MGSAIVVATLSVPTYCQISSPLHISPSRLDQVALNSIRSCPGCSVTCRRLDWRRHFAADRQRHFAADRRRHSAVLTGGGGTSRPDRRRHSAAWTGGGTSRRRRSESWPGPAPLHSAAWTGCSSATAAPWLWLLGPLSGFPYCGTTVMVVLARSPGRVQMGPAG